MRLGIVDHHVARIEQTVDDRDHALVAEVEQEGVLLADEGGQFALELLVVFGLAAHHAGAHRRGHAELGRALGVGFAHLGMVGQAEVVVQAPVEHHLPAEAHVGAELTLQFGECEIAVRIGHVLPDGASGIFLQTCKNIHHNIVLF